MLRWYPTLLSILAAGPCWLGVDAAMAAGVPRATPSTEIILAGGALAICSDFSPRACREAPEAERHPPMYRLDREGSLRAGDARLRTAGGAPNADAVAHWLQSAIDGAGEDPLARDRKSVV